MGNGVVSGMNKGIQKNIVESFTGHLVVVSTNQKMDNVLLTPMGKSTEVIRGYTNVRTVLRKLKEVKDFMPIGRGIAMTLSDDVDPDFTMLFGVKFDDYLRFFPNSIELIEGEAPLQKKRGIILTKSTREKMYENTSFWMKPESVPFKATNLSASAKSNLRSLAFKSNLVIMGFTSDGTALDIRVPVKAVFDYKTLKKFWDRMNLIDIESFRECFNLTTSDEATAFIPKEDKKLLSSDELDMDSLFSDNITSPETVQDAYSLDSLKFASKPKTENKLTDLDAGAYQIVLVKLKPGVSLQDGVKIVGKALKDAGVDGRAIPWQRAAGQVGDFATIIRVALNVFVMILFLVAAIIIMNTLSMTALERTTEIGMMRAVGARKRFISDMFFVETGMLALVFGGIGVLVGILTVNLLALPGWTSDNEFLQLLFGGDKFHPILYAGDIMFIIIQLAFVTLLAALYPIMIARKITPLEAIARD